MTDLIERAMVSGINSSWLNPPNRGQGRISIYLGKPLRAIARTVYCLVCLTILPAIDALCNFTQAVDNRLIASSQDLAWEEELKKRAWKHLTASLLDALIGLVSCGTVAASVYCAVTARNRALMSQKIASWALASIFGAAIMIYPCAYGLWPDKYKVLFAK